MQMCVGCAGTAISCHSAAPFPPLHRRWQCPNCALRHTESRPLLKALGYLGRHWEHPDTGCAGGKAGKSVMAPPLFCWEGGAEARAQCRHGESASSTSAGVMWEKAEWMLVVGGCGCRQLLGACGVGGSWVGLEETWNVTNQCLFHSYLSHMQFKAFAIWDDAGITKN